MPKGALVVGGGPAGVRAALDLAEAGIRVHLVEGSASLGDGLLPAPLNPPNFGGKGDGAALWRARPRLLAAANHPLIELLTEAEVAQIEGERGDYHVTVHQRPRYVDPARCTDCGECVAVCPVTSQRDGSAHKAIFRGLVPTVFHIEKRGTAPCRYACPAHQRAQGYIALIRERRYEEAYRVIKEDNPFPSICGRICDHRCESECSRNKVDEPVSIMALKRFVADWAYARGKETRKQGEKGTRGQDGPRVAIVGSGPAGLTAAQDLVRLGYGVTVFEALPVAGGMMRVGVPEFRLPRELLQWEIDQIVAQGVELRLNHRVESLDVLIEAGYEAVFLATGAHQGRKLPLPGADHPDVLLNTDFLFRVNLGEKVALGDRVLVLGGGNVAIDVARTAVRLGPREVHMACLESRAQMPAHPWEIEAAEEEGIVVHPSRTFKEVVIQNDRVVGVRCVEVDFRGFVDGRPDMDEIPGTEHILPADTVIFAIGQAPDLSYLDRGVERTRWGTIVVDPDTLATGRPGVFAGGDVVTGTAFVIDAIAAGHRAARSIDRYLRGEALIPTEPALQPEVELSEEEIAERLARGEIVRRPRARMPQLPLAERRGNFRQVDLGLSEEQALAEAERCLSCGVCSECLECVQVCPPQAIDHETQARDVVLDVGAIIWADGSETERGGARIAPEDVVEASAAAAQVMLTLLKYRERPLVPPVPLVPSVPSEVAVFLCRCGGEISDVVDLAAVGEVLQRLPGVALVQEVSFACHEEGAQAIERAIAERGLGRAVLAACSCCSLDQICYSCSTQRLRCKGNLLPRISAHPWLEFVNIREHCAFVHRDDPAAATAKAMDLVTAAVAKARLSEPWPGKAMAVRTTALIVGRGPGAEASAEALTALGFNVVRAEAEAVERIRGGAGDFAVNMRGERLLRAGAIILALGSEKERAGLVEAFGAEGLFQARDPLWAPVESRVPGVFLADAASAGWAAAARVVGLLGRGWVQIQPTVARVDAARCRGCGDCVAVCPFGALRLVEEDPPRSPRWQGEEGLAVAQVSEALCQGCGACLAHCPTGAITAGYSSDRQIEAMLEAMLA